MSLVVVPLQRSSNPKRGDLDCFSFSSGVQQQRQQLVNDRGRDSKAQSRMPSDPRAGDMDGPATIKIHGKSSFRQRNLGGVEQRVRRVADPLRSLIISARKNTWNAGKTGRILSHRRALTVVKFSRLFSNCRTAGSRTWDGGRDRDLDDDRRGSRKSLDRRCVFSGPLRSRSA